MAEFLPQTVPAIVLAAGWSSRMGAFKPLLPFGERTVVEHVISTLAASSKGKIYVVLGHQAAEMVPVVEAAGAVAVVNAAFAEGMMSSIKAGIAALPDAAQGAMIMPVDMPLIRAATLVKLAEEAGQGGAPILRPAFRGRAGHPPFIHRRLFAEVLAAPAETTLRDIIERHQQDAKSIPVIDSGVVRDMDCPDDYDRLLAALPRRRHPDETECAAMQDAVGTPEPTRRHCSVVADLAVEIADRLRDGGLTVDTDAIRAGALLHDIAKGEPDHAVAGARYVAAFGFGDVASIIRHHTDISFEPSQPIDERHVVFLADKLIRGERRVGLDERFAPALTAFAADPVALAHAQRRRATAFTLFARIEAMIGPLGHVPNIANASAPSEKSTP